jgi:serine/threonine protein kinase/Flp pilus assembly protein TadD
MIGQKILHYKILEKLGEGGMGVVYKAEDTKLNREVAIKFLPRQIVVSEEERERFRIEAQAAAALNHPNIATIHNIEEVDEEMFIVMEYIDGQELEDKIETGPLSIDDTLDLAIQIAKGLQAAHAKDVIHRDIKSANVMLTGRGDVKIMDFGLAKLGGQGKLTKEGTSMGTVAYMSPEQTRGIKVDHRADIWALGAVIYEMISGKQPFAGDYEQAVIYSIMNEDPEPPTALRTGLPMELERIVLKALAKEPGERYQHIDEMLLDLRGVQSKSQTGQLTKQSPRKSTRLKPFIYWSSGLLVLLLIVFIMLFPSGRGEPIDSIAVLPLENPLGDPQQNFFADGMTETLITDLSKISALRVISRTSVMRYKSTEKSLPQIADELGVDAVVEGSVLRIGDTVRITAQLIHAKTDRHLWAESYDQKLSDVLALHKKMARTIVGEIKAKLPPEEEKYLTKSISVDSKAHEAYLRGRYLWNRRTKQSVESSIDYFKKAIQIDPSYANAYVGLADAYNIMGDYRFSPPLEALPKVKEAALRALDLDETLGEAYTALGKASHLFEWNWSAAESYFQKAIELNPNYASAYQWYAEYLVTMGRYEEAITRMEHALTLDPLSLIINTNVGWMYYFAGRYDEAVEPYEKAVALEPTFSPAHEKLGHLYLEIGMFEEAMEQLHKHKTLLGGGPNANLGYGYTVIGNTQECMKIVNDLERIAGVGNVSFGIALLYSGLGQNDHAFKWLEKAYEKRVAQLVWVNADPRFKNLHSDPRFPAFLQKMGLER